MTTRPPIQRRILLAVLAAIAALGLASCTTDIEPVLSSSTGEADTTTSTTSAPAAASITVATTTTADTTTTTEPALTDAELDTIDWKPCGNLQCATVEVPIDYDDPDSDTIAIAINKRPADSLDERIGYLLTNPGGPGETGLQFVREAGSVGSPAILERFDIIGFDPRGIGESEPTLSCGSDDEQNEIVDAFNGDYDSPSYIEFGERMLALCFENSGPALSRVHAEYVARDMDEIRKALGVEHINFLGLSWGAHIGGWYATLFPEHTRAMVIDAALDPTQIGHTRIEMQRGYEIMLRQALNACDSSCPIYNGADPIGYYLEAMEKYGLVADAMGEDGNVWAALIEPVYSAEAFPQLWNAIYELGENDNPAPFVEIGSQADNDEPTDEELAMIEKNRFVNISANCVDEFVLHPEVTRDYLLNEEVDIDRPLMDAAFASAAGSSDVDSGPSLEFCAFLHPYAPPVFTGAFDGSDVPIVVVANAFEGPIPYGQSKTLATEVLSNGYLVDVLGSRQHVVYPTNQCVVDIVDAHLLTTELPVDRTTTCEVEDQAENQSIDAMANRIHRMCVDRVVGGLEQSIEFAEQRAEFVCEDLVNQAIAEEGPSGLDNGVLLDRLLIDAIDKADSFDSPADLMTAFCLRVIRDEIEPKRGPVPAEQAASICETVISRAVAEGGEEALDDDELLQNIFGEVLEEQLDDD